MAQNGCIPLADSTACRAFGTASISTGSDLVGLFPFLSNVSDASSFDTGIAAYIAGDFTQLRYEQLIGCDNVQLDNTTDFYARYTTSVLCNAIIQNSIEPCGLSGSATRPLCADSCAEYAQSEQQIAASNICGTAGDNALTQIRADFTNCALPANSITGSCIKGVENQPNDCGFTENLSGLCSYCSASSPNSTDSCCVFSNTDNRCEGVQLPVIAAESLAPVTLTVSATATPGAATSGASSDNSNDGLSGGQIAGIVVGSILGALFLLGLIVVGCLLFKRRRDSSPVSSVFNQPAPARRQQEMEYHDGTRDYQERAGPAVLPGGRVARMSALESSGNSEYLYGMGRYSKDISAEENTPDSRLAPPPKRSGSVSSGSQLGVDGAALQDTSPSSGGDFTSPESHGQSEQLNFFKDYYSQDEIRAGDLVSTLWAYEPRAGDEFQLERGDMIKVIGIWDDGWATGVRVRQRAEDWRDDDKVQRDSGLSTAPASRDQDAAEDGEVKAFPLVCVCLPAHWRKTIEGDSTEGSGPGVFPERG
ncbi:Putative SH3-like domain superfamily protein [Septoria linicola]|uniref:SH3-like domain superfamily protein n=1 Tax=Septoria linicola TaxID=215465 RepID=A0A9Q9AYC5_9PEZI|nr:putative SH3-like domain superfamily protein [Septoria linicola]USW57380.1 Putative SH3-like domain superfamily protein [Septoria linicola]